MDLKVLTTCSSRSGGIVHLYCFVVFHTNRIHFVATSFEWRFIENLWNWYSVHFYLLSTLQFSLSSLYEHTTIKRNSSFFIFLFLNAFQHSPKSNHWTFLSHFVLRLFSSQSRFFFFCEVAHMSRLMADGVYVDKMWVQNRNSSFCSHECSLLHSNNQVFSLSKWVTLV